MRFTVLCYISPLFHTAGILSKNSSYLKKKASWKANNAYLTLLGLQWCLIKMSYLSAILSVSAQPQCGCSSMTEHVLVVLYTSWLDSMSCSPMFCCKHNYLMSNFNDRLLKYISWQCIPPLLFWLKCDWLESLPPTKKINCIYMEKRNETRMAFTSPNTIESHWMSKRGTR